MTPVSGKALTKYTMTTEGTEAPSANFLAYTEDYTQIPTPLTLCTSILVASTVMSPLVVTTLSRMIASNSSMVIVPAVSEVAFTVAT